MATIAERKRKNGNISYMVQIIKRGYGFKESRTFDSRRVAEAWARKREREIQEDIDAGRPITSQKIAQKTLGDAIDLYIAESHQQIGKTKTQVLRTIQKDYGPDIANVRCDLITSKTIVDFAKKLHDRDGVTSASTVLNYLSHLSSIFAIARPAWNLPLDEKAMKDAMTVCKKMGYTKKSKSRTRRPSIDEVNRLMEYFLEKRIARPNQNPMHKIIAFALFSTRRQEEITRLHWADYDPKHKRILVRDMKHPGEKIGNDVFVDLPDPCCAIIDTMPRTGTYIFPYGVDAISAAFTRACKFLEITDLHFHDLRHEGISRLMEMGYSIPHAAKVSGHKSWQSLQRYSHINKTGDKWEGWEWIKKLKDTNLDRKRLENSKTNQNEK
ncbi:site-specific integrase [Paracoccus sp. AK26]|uniref:site-specific integrase n=1 Tax=Paracoccus sp. AK26 TaxID=2589076 RepID=UPI0014286E24|nr:site-specific integrase [Paracoccus sp. AK26]QIR84495.1 site-specific integrase [Paracoccus sp. AK26]